MDLTHRMENGMVIREMNPAGSRKALVYFHGLGESGLCFERLMRNPCLRDWVHLVPDLPGYGRSPWRDRPMTLGEQVDHLAGWLKTRGVRRYVLLGHSMGGVAGVLFAERYADRLAGLVNVEGNITPGDCVFSSRAASHTEASFLQSGFDDLRDRVYQEGRDDRVLRQYHVGLSLADPRQFHCNSLELLRESGDGCMAQRMAALQMPILYIAGSPRGIVPESKEKLADAGIPVSVIPDSGHWPFRNDEPRFVQVLRRFLDSLPESDYSG